MNNFNRFHLVFLLAVIFTSQACSQLNDSNEILIGNKGTPGNEIIEPEPDPITQPRIPVIPGPIEMGEVGLIPALSDTEITVMFQREYANPIVIANSPSYFGADTALVRITNVYSDRMTIRLVEAPDRDGVHTFENLSYLVIEEGSWMTYPGNHRIEAGRVNSDANYLGTLGEVEANFNDRWEAISFANDFGETPAVWAQVQSASNQISEAECLANRMECSKIYYLQNRQRNESSMGFEVAMQQERTEANPHPTESIGWIAMNTAMGEWSGLSFETRVTEPLVDHMFRQISFLMSFIAPPRLITGMQGLAGGNPAHLRQRNLTTSSFELMVEEDQGDLDPNDPNTFLHGMESISYFAIGGTGILTATPID